jgi:hypothetical protein
VDGAEALVQTTVAAELRQLRVLTGTIARELEVRRMVDVPARRQALDELPACTVAAIEDPDMAVRGAHEV